MMDRDSLNLVYSFDDGARVPNLPPHPGPQKYRVLAFFSDRGAIGDAEREKALEEMGLDPNSRPHFESLDQLEEFALKICELVNAGEVYLLSTQDYNAIVEQVNNVRGFREIFRRYGSCLTNQNFKNKNSLFSKLFS